VSSGFYFQAQIIAKILKVVFGDDTVLIEMSGQFEGTDNPGRKDALHVQHTHVELGVVGHDHVFGIVDQVVELIEFLTPCERWFVLNHLLGDVVDGHCIDGDGLTGIEQFTDGLATLGFEGNLAESVVRPSAGGFGVEEDEHIIIACGPLVLDYVYSSLTCSQLCG